MILPDVGQPRASAKGSDVGPYRLVRALGKGGMAEVFLAVHRHLGLVRAVKVLWPEESEERAALAQRLLMEARATCRLHHPGIVEIYDCDTLPGGGAFIAMEYLQGEPAAKWLERTGPLAAQPRLAAALVGAIADALDHAHREGIVHRDVKPDNVVLVPDPDDRALFAVKVLDFGIAKILHERPLVVTRSDRALGTPYYMAPEQWYGNGKMDARADIYGLGCVFFEVLTGRTPFERDDGIAMMHAHLQEAPPRLRELYPEIPGALDDLVTRMLAKSARDRPQAMSDVVRAIAAYLGCDHQAFAQLLRAPDEHPVASGPAQRSEPTVLGLGDGGSAGGETTAPLTTTRQRRARIGIGAVGIVVLGVAGVLAVGRLGHETHDTVPAMPPAAPAPVPPPVDPPAPAPVVPAPVVPAIIETPPAKAPEPPARAAHVPDAHKPRPRPRNVYRPVGD